MRRFTFINDLSVRASYGLAGNEPSADYAFYNKYGNFDWSYLGVGGVYPQTIQLNNLKWEVVHGANLGANLIMLQRRINIDADIYRNRTTDLLFKDLQVRQVFTVFSCDTFLLGIKWRNLPDYIFIM